MSVVDGRGGDGGWMVLVAVENGKLSAENWVVVIEQRCGISRLRVALPWG